MIASFTQTYGNERDLGHRDRLYEAYSKDSRLIEFKNLFDLNFHSFHDCDPSVIENYKSLNKVEKSVYLEHLEIPYGGTIGEMIKVLEMNGVTHLFFHQDDCFSADNEETNFVELLEYVKGFKENFMLNLSYTSEYLNYLDLPCEDHRSFGVYHTNTKDFARADKFAMDDQPYIATMDIIRRIYGDYYVKDYRTIWRLEENLSEFCASYSIPRFTLDRPIFMNYNLMGRNAFRRKDQTAALYEKGILT